jgi:arylformamidase
MEANKASVGTGVTRRAVLGAVAAGALLTMSAAFAQPPGPAQQAPRVKGPRVWLDMDQAELDAAYDQSVCAPNLQQIVRRYATNSEAVRARLGPPRPTPTEQPRSKGSTST